MGYSLHAVEDLGAPFLIVHEQIVLIPDSGAQATANAARKLIFLLHGECRHRIEGVPNSEVELRAGDVMVVPHRCRHVYVSPKPGEAWRVQALRLAFDPAVVPPLPLRGAPVATPSLPEAETDLAAFASHHFREFRHLPGAQDARVREALAQVREEAQNRAPGYRHRVRALCTSLVTLVARQTMAADAEAGETQGSEGDRRRAYLVTRAKDYLLRHLDQPLTLGRVAAHVAVSEQHLARLFRQATGQTVFEYVRLMRFEAAKSYLSGSDRNVAEVARLTGFTSLPVFSRTFRREVGVSPSEYRRRVSGDVG